MVYSKVSHRVESQQVTYLNTTVPVNPLNPHDALKHHFKSLKTD